jgi:hypothetical protein
MIFFRYRKISVGAGRCAASRREANPGGFNALFRPLGKDVRRRRFISLFLGRSFFPSMNRRRHVPDIVVWRPGILSGGNERAIG